MHPTRRSLLQLLAGSVILWPTAGLAAPSVGAGSIGGSSSKSTKRGYITFIINVHEWGHLDGSAEILESLCKLYTNKGVKGEFYVTSVMAEKLEKNHPETISAMKLHGLSYHVRPPHPLYSGFDTDLKKLSGDDLTNTIKDFETYGQSLSTGELDKSKSGGYTKVKEVFGRAPCAVSCQNDSPTILTAASSVYKSLGAKMIVAFHEGESDPDNPFVNKYNLLVRPSHLKMTHSSGDDFWWNTVSAGKGGDPTESLKNQLDAWNHTKLPFATAIIHENNFYRSGPESWTSIYYKDKDKKTVLAAPWDLKAAEWGKARDDDSKQKIWSAYKGLVDYCSENMNVVTSEDIYKLSTQ